MIEEQLLIRDGELIGAIAEERLDRVKFSYSTEIPFKSIDALSNITILYLQI